MVPDPGHDGRGVFPTEFETVFGLTLLSSSPNQEPVHEMKVKRARRFHDREAMACDLGF